MAKEIASWKQDMQDAAVKTAKDERPAESYISLKGGVMTYQDQPMDNNQVEVVIRVWFSVAGEGATVQDSPQADCYADLWHGQCGGGRVCHLERTPDQHQELLKLCGEGCQQRRSANVGSYHDD